MSPAGGVNCLCSQPWEEHALRRGGLWDAVRPSDSLTEQRPQTKLYQRPRPVQSRSSIAE